MRVFTGSLVTETNTFSPIPTGMSAFRERGYFPAGSHPSHLLFYAGPLWAARLSSKEHGWHLIEGMVASAQPGGITTKNAYEELREELLSDLRNAMPVDIVLLGLHGAMVADGYEDCEGDILKRVRNIVGTKAVIGAELDPHCHLSDDMVQNADILIAFKEYPHTDVVERAFELVDLCNATYKKEIHPIASVVDCDMLITMHTTRDPGKGFVQKLQSIEGTNGILSISVIHGFPYGDTSSTGTKVLVYSDFNREAGAAVAEELARELIEIRTELTPKFPNLDSALHMAELAPKGPVVLADSADNPGGGSAGDSTFILQELIRRKFKGSIVGPLWDPMSVRIAFEAGLSAHLPIRVGGKCGPLSGLPVDAVWHVLALQKDMQMSALTGGGLALGDCALIECEGVEVVLVSTRNQALGTDLFTGLGCNLSSKRLIVVKSSQHFYAAFAPIASQVIYVDAPGAVPYDLRSLPYKHLKRPKWPLDE